MPEHRKTPKRRAVLIFAQALPLDLRRRRWPKSFARLLSLKSLRPGLSQLGADVHLFTSPLPANAPGPSQPQRVHPQSSGSFASKLEAAVAKLAGLGYEEIVIIGRDCPDLRCSDVEEAFDHLNSHGLVVGPDHRGGVYLIGLRAADRDKLRGIHWQQDTDLAQLVDRFGRAQTFSLPILIDLDTLADVLLLARTESSWRQVARALFLELRQVWMVIRSPHLPTVVDRQRVAWQLPPP